MEFIEKPQSELDFEQNLIDYLQHIGGSKQWEYRPDIKTIPGLWKNFRSILERNNADKLLGKPLSDQEFAQVQKEIKALTSPFKAGQWIYGVGGVTQVTVQRDDANGGKVIYLTVFDQDQVGAGNTTYQIVNQVQRHHVQAGTKDCRFDTTLLINGLPIIQIEEKTSSHDALEGLNQIRQYIGCGLYGDIYSTVQILIGMTPTDVRYMANTDADSFNTAFAFHWQDEQRSTPVFGWKEFCNSFLSIPQAHRMATSYMILDNAKNHKNLIVMRPYQVYATKRVLERLRNHTFGTDNQEVGYIWHTTGSGKTISSFKTAWLASRLPNVDKVVFVVDRRALTRQTFDNYQAYDPDYDPEQAVGSDDKQGIISDTANVNDLRRKLRSNSTRHSIIVTSIQKLAKLCKSDAFPTQDNKNVVFIVDEAHRSTNGEMLPQIKKKFPRSAWVGYTGTPAFDGDLTQKAFGNLIHAYTIREAIADKNVLGFHVDFEHTLPDAEIREKVLPVVLKEKYPSWTDKEIDNAIARMSNDEAEDYVDSGVYDNNPQHIEKVVEDIVKKWRNRSENFRYDAILTTHVRSGGSSIPMALAYYREFKKANNRLASEGKRTIKVAVTFSYATDNSSRQFDDNKGLREAIRDYDSLFNTSFAGDELNVDDYFTDIMERLADKQRDGEKLDLVIVVDQLLTGYDAPKVNTLYVDRLLAGANLIQAYSRTNRIEDPHLKPFGHIVNYRYPVVAKKLMDEAISVYANRDSAVVQDTLPEPEPPTPEPNPIIMPAFKEKTKQTADLLAEISNMTDGFRICPPSENEKEHLAQLIMQVSDDVAALKQYPEFDYDHPEQLYNLLDVEKEQYEWTVSTLWRMVAPEPPSPNPVMPSLVFRVEHITDVRVNYDYITKLLADLLNAVHNGDDDVQQRYNELEQQTAAMDNRHQATRVLSTARAAMSGQLDNGIVNYPAKPEDMDDVINQHTQETRRHEVLEFKKKWGLVDVTTAQILIDHIIDRHVEGNDDLNQGSELEKLLKGALTRDGNGCYYQHDAEDPEIRSLSRLQYRNKLSGALREFADRMVRDY